jgi:hypothetical protein
MFTLMQVLSPQSTNISLPYFDAVTAAVTTAVTASGETSGMKTFFVHVSPA